jgi:hypothetical protein
VGDPEGKSVLSLFDATNGVNLACASQTLFSYSGYEQNLAVAASAEGIFTTGLFENCGFGHYVQVLSRFDPAGGLLGRVTEPGVSFTGRNCIGPSAGYSVAAAPGGPVFVAGVSGLTGEGASRGFVTRFDSLAQAWKSRSPNASDFSAVAVDPEAVFTAGTCFGQPCIERHDPETGGIVWAQTYGFNGSLQALVAPGNGHVYATGVMTQGGNSDAILLGVNAQTGLQTAFEPFDASDNDAGRAIASSGNGLYVSGDSTDPAGTALFVLRYNLVE